MLDLVAEINRAFVRFAPDYVSEPEKAVYRIYRDTRFSSDKTPYKTHIAAIFNRRGLEKHAGAAYYFSIAPKEIEIAGGVYMPGPKQLLAIRNHIAESCQEFSVLASNQRLRKEMEDLKGEALTRAPKGFDPAHPAANYIRMKQWLFYTMLDPGLAATDQLFPEIVKRFRLLTPFIEFLNRPFAKRRPVSAKDLMF
jgi:uncharacterized protein (TIGR02453 family)